MYNLKMVKTEMARGPLNFAEIRNPFGFLQTYPQADAWWVGHNLFLKKVFLWYTLVSALNLPPLCQEPHVLL